MTDSDQTLLSVKSDESIQRLFIFKDDRSSLVEFSSVGFDLGYAFTRYLDFIFDPLINAPTPSAYEKVVKKYSAGCWDHSDMSYQQYLETICKYVFEKATFTTLFSSYDVTCSTSDELRVTPCVPEEVLVYPVSLIFHCFSFEYNSRYKFCFSQLYPFTYPPKSPGGFLFRDFVAYMRSNFKIFLLPSGDS